MGGLVLRIWDDVCARIPDDASEWTYVWDQGVVSATTLSLPSTVPDLPASQKIHVTQLICSVPPWILFPLELIGATGNHGILFLCDGGGGQRLW